MSVQSDEPTPAQEAPLQAAPDGSTTDATAQDTSEETLRSELAEITQKADEYLRLAQRTQADFVNYRRRIAEERQQQAQTANLAYLQRLLPILDDFERALAAGSPDELESNWGKGVQLVERNLRSLVSSEGVERINAEGAEFDPRQHEALGRQPSTEVPEGHVLHVIRPGYRKGDRVIRPAQVIVAGGTD